MNDKKLIVNLRRRVNRARDFPTNTCPSSRHVHNMAEFLSRKGGYPMLQDEPEHCAISLYSVVLSLWQARREIERLKAKKGKS